MHLPKTTSICSIQDVFDAAKRHVFPGDGGSHFTPQRGYIWFKTTRPGQISNVRLENVTEHVAWQIVISNSLINVTFTDY